MRRFSWPDVLDPITLLVLPLFVLVGVAQAQPLTCPPPLTVAAAPGATTATVVLPAVSSAAQSATVSPANPFPVGTTTVTYTVPAQAAKTCTTTVTVTATPQPPPPPPPPPVSTLVGHWRFDETAGTVAADSSGNGRTGTLVNGPTWVAGHVGNALNLDGVNDYVTVADTPALNPARLTLAAWVNLRSNAVTQRIIDRDGAGTITYFLGVSGNPSQLSFRAGGLVVTSTATVTANTWHHVAGTYDGAALRVYIDGVLVGSLAGTVTIADNGVPINIGRRPGPSTTSGSLFVGGLIDDVRIYGSGLSASEIAALVGVVPPPPPPPPPPTGAAITLNPIVTFQTMRGWESPTSGTVRDYLPALPVMGTLADQAVADLGINMASLGVGSGSEQPGTCERDYLTGVINEGQFIGTCHYNGVNDNADPLVANLAGFQFTLLDYQVDNVVLPLKTRVEARGEKLYLLFRYVDFGASMFEHYTNPAEYAEFLLVMFDHLKAKYGIVPDGVDTMNEGDQVAGWNGGNGTTYGQAIAAAGVRLAAAGYHPEFFAPSSVNKANAVPYMNAILAVPGASPFVKVLSWHCYSDTGTNTSAAIGARALAAGLSTAMTECQTTGNTYLALHAELKTSRAAFWQLGILHGANGYYAVANGQVTLRPKAQFIRQYYKYIRAGAGRIDVTSTSATFDPVAFRNTDGKTVVVVKATAAGSFSVGNLPAGTYGVFYTTGPDGLTVTASAALPDQTITAGQHLTTAIPGAGAITIYAKGGSAPPPPPPPPPPPLPPPPPTGSIEPALTIIWTKAAGATDYDIAYGTSPGAYTVRKPTGDTNSAVLPNLQPNTVYFLSLRALHPSGWSAQSAEFQGKTGS